MSATLPQATTTIDSTAGAQAGSSDYTIVVGCTRLSADATPRVFASAKAILSQHAYCPAADYAALHIQGTKKPVQFLGLPIATAGALAYSSTAGVTGTSLLSVAASTADGYMEETYSTVTVTTGGTVGTAGIVFNFSPDGGRTQSSIRLGTATSYAVPNLNATITFGAGTLNVGDVYTYVTTAPMWQNSDFTAAFTALAAQQLLARSVMVVGEIANSTFAGYVTTQVDAYETADDRYLYARVNIKDRLPLPQMTQARVAAVGGPAITFAAGTTATRATGSWITDGFAVGDVVTFTSTGVAGLNNAVTAIITTLTATIMTCSATTFTAETGAAGAYAVVGSPGLIFTSTTATRYAGSGSWITDGFAVGDVVTFKGTVSNNITVTITVLTASVMTFASGGAAETIESHLVTATKGLTMSAWINAAGVAQASVVDRRIDMAAGRARVVSPITSYSFRRPAAWAVAIREFTKTEQIPTWRKSDGPLTGWDMTDGNGNIVEYDERTVGGALAAGFTCLRTYGNGPNGAFVAMSLTRDVNTSLLSQTHNMAVCDVAQSVCQAECENAIGQVLVLNSDGTATAASLGLIAERVNSQLQINLLQSDNSSPDNTPLASEATWVPATDDVLNVPTATLHGTLNLLLNGTLVDINTLIRVQTAGAAT